ncbi:Notchless -like protein 1 [Trichinella nelsoni]|uniref:Notchless-like protein 1 n=1 Tax=Trichinella nelsoni TaxID=6336 RepID=A0A0V0RJM0_9BILA|nr:Notchless -like protein 1 [Trichinella nelsoni]
MKTCLWSRRRGHSLTCLNIDIPYQPDQLTVFCRDCCAKEANVVFVKDGIISEATLNVLADEEGSVFEKRREPLQNVILSGLRVQSITFAYETFGAITSAGNIYMWGRSNYGQCGIIAENLAKPERSVNHDIVEVEIHAADDYCMHGERREPYDIQIVHLSIGGSEVLAVDKNGALWAWGAAFQNGDSTAWQPICLPYRVPGLLGRRVLSVASGRTHHVALVEYIAGVDELHGLDEYAFLGNSSNCFQSNLPFVESCEHCQRGRRSVLTDGESTKSSSTDEPSSSPVGRCPLGVKLSFADDAECFLEPRPECKPRSKSQAGQRKLYSDANCRGDEVELYELPRSKQQHQASSSRLSFISFDLIMPSSSSSSSLSEQTISLDDSNALAGCVSGQSIIPGSSNLTGNTICLAELWTWGGNEFGQLGLNDFEPRCEPTRISGSSAFGIVKIAAGAEHSIAMSSSGEVFVWGSNENRQIKVADQRRVAVPMLFKAGSCAKVIDIAAGEKFSAFLINGIDYRPECYICGYDRSDKDGTPVLRLYFPETCWPASLMCSDDYIICGCLEDTDAALCNVFYQIQFILIRHVQILKQLVDLINEIREESTFVDRFDESLFRRFAAGLRRYHLILANKSQSIKQYLFVLDVKATVEKSLEILLDSRFQNFLKQLNADYLILLSGDAFSLLKLNESVEKKLRYLCELNSVEHHKQSRLLQDVFFLPFTVFSDLHLIIAQFNGDDKFTKNTLKMLKSVDRVFRFYKNIASDTRKFRLKHAHSSFLAEMNEKAQFLVKEFQRGQEPNEFVDVTENGRTVHCYLLAIFSGSFLVVTKSFFKNYKFPLVWTHNIQDDANLLVKVIVPEGEFMIKFRDPSGTKEFVIAFNNALLLYLSKPCSETPLLCRPPLIRSGTHQFSAQNKTFPGAVYSGSWLLGKPHGNGHLTTKNNCVYGGHFRDGLMDGYGEYKIVGENGRWQFSKGQWRAGVLSGLVFIEYSDGSSYEGYFENNVRHGHGVHRQGSILYVGAWQNDKRQGYGVSDECRSKYLGMWENDLKHGLGTLVTLDGICYKGVFEKGTFKNGMMLLTDGTMAKGEFSDVECLNGKASIYFPNGDYLEGFLSGRLQEQLKISSGNFYKNGCCSSDGIKSEKDKQNNVHDFENSGFPPAEQKWNDIFAHVYHQLNCAEDTLLTADTNKCWQSLVVVCERFRKYFPTQKLQTTSSSSSSSSTNTADFIEKIPNYSMPCGEQYYYMVKNYCFQAFQLQYHPLGRLINGLSDIFNVSYSGVSVHSSLLVEAIEEIHSLLKRLYFVIKVLFPHLPGEQDMESFVSEFNFDLPLSSCLTTYNTFLYDSYLELVYPNIFTLFVIKNEELDRVYWMNIRYVNSKSDVMLLDHLGVEKQFWPVIFTDTSDLDKPLACATARKKYYADAIDCFQRLSSEFFPSAKLKIIVETFEHINKCVSQGACVEQELTAWTADSLVPVTTYVIVRAQIQRLGAEINFVQDFCPQLCNVGEMQYIEIKLYTTKLLSDVRRLAIRFQDESGNPVGTVYDMPFNITPEQLETVCNMEFRKNEEPLKYSFFVHDLEIESSLEETIDMNKINMEQVLLIRYQAHAIYKVQTVTRCTSSLPGHAETVISALFSHDGRYMASGSGDRTVRFWDLNTELPQFTCSHTDWVLCLSWSPDGQRLASGCKEGKICIWDPETGKQIGKTLVGHKLWITCLCWEPLHQQGTARLLASSSKDHDIRIWDVVLNQTLRVLSGHTASVSCIRWGGEGLIYSASQDRTLKMWRVDKGILCRTFQGHGHWVNTIALNTDYVLRTGAFDPKDFRNDGTTLPATSAQELKNIALNRYKKFTRNEPEMLVSGSDDFTLFLWSPSTSKKPLARMTGHQQLINQVLFSPDGRIIASASFDHSIKIWCGKTGKFLHTLRGHVQSVFQISWSSDSRLLVSGSADSTLKLWDISARKLIVDLPGHADAVYAVDWSPRGDRVVSGGKDKVLKIWRN